MNMFEIAVRNKMRFETTKGLISVEDLWDLPMLTKSPTAISLDNVARKIAIDLTEQEKLNSFVAENGNDAVIKELNVKLEIVKYVIAVRKKEAEEKRNAAESAMKRQKIKELIAQKEDDALSSLSKEELLEMLAEV